MQEKAGPSQYYFFLFIFVFFLIIFDFVNFSKLMFVFFQNADFGRLFTLILEYFTWNLFTNSATGFSLDSFVYLRHFPSSMKHICGKMWCVLFYVRVARTLSGYQFTYIQNIQCGIYLKQGLVCLSVGFWWVLRVIHFRTFMKIFLEYVENQRKQY